MNYQQMLSQKQKYGKHEKHQKYCPPEHSQSYNNQSYHRQYHPSSNADSKQINININLKVHQSHVNAVKKQTDKQKSCIYNNKVMRSTQFLNENDDSAMMGMMSIESLKKNKRKYEQQIKQLENGYHRNSNHSQFVLLQPEHLQSTRTDAYTRSSKQNKNLHSISSASQIQQHQHNSKTQQQHRRPSIKYTQTSNRQYQLDQYSQTESGYITTLNDQTVGCKSQDLKTAEHNRYNHDAAENLDTFAIQDQHQFEVYEREGIKNYNHLSSKNINKKLSGKKVTTCNANLKSKGSKNVPARKKSSKGLNTSNNAPKSKRNNRFPQEKSHSKSCHSHSKSHRSRSKSHKTKTKRFQRSHHFQKSPAGISKSKSKSRGSVSPSIKQHSRSKQSAIKPFKLSKSIKMNDFSKSVSISRELQKAMYGACNKIKDLSKQKKQTENVRSASKKNMQKSRQRQKQICSKSKSKSKQRTISRSKSKSIPKRKSNRNSTSNTFIKTVPTAASSFTLLKHPKKTNFYNPNPATRSNSNILFNKKAAQRPSNIGKNPKNSKLNHQTSTNIKKQKTPKKKKDTTKSSKYLISPFLEKDKQLLQNLAAKHIQKIFRGYRVRKQFKNDLQMIKDRVSLVKNSISKKASAFWLSSQKKVFKNNSQDQISQLSSNSDSVQNLQESNLKQVLKLPNNRFFKKKNATTFQKPSITQLPEDHIQNFQLNTRNKQFEKQNSESINSLAGSLDASKNAEKDLFLMKKLLEQNARLKQQVKSYESSGSSLSSKKSIGHQPLTTKKEQQKVQNKNSGLLQRSLSDFNPILQKSKFPNSSGKGGCGQSLGDLSPVIKTEESSDMIFLGEQHSFNRSTSKKKTVGLMNLEDPILQHDTGSEPINDQKQMIQSFKKKFQFYDVCSPKNVNSLQKNTLANKFSIHDKPDVQFQKVPQKSQLELSSHALEAEYEKRINILGKIKMDNIISPKTWDLKVKNVTAQYEKSKIALFEKDISTKTPEQNKVRFQNQQQKSQKDSQTKLKDAQVKNEKIAAFRELKQQQQTVTMVNNTANDKCIDQQQQAKAINNNNFFPQEKSFQFLQRSAKYSKEPVSTYEQILHRQKQQNQRKQLLQQHVQASKPDFQKTGDIRDIDKILKEVESKSYQSIQPPPTLKQQQKIQQQQSYQNQKTISIGELIKRDSIRQTINFSGQQHQNATQQSDQCVVNVNINFDVKQTKNQQNIISNQSHSHHSHGQVHQKTQQRKVLNPDIQQNQQQQQKSQKEHHYQEQQRFSQDVEQNENQNHRNQEQEPQRQLNRENSGSHGFQTNLLFLKNFIFAFFDYLRKYPKLEACIAENLLQNGYKNSHLLACYRTQMCDIDEQVRLYQLKLYQAYPPDSNQGRSLAYPYWKSLIDYEPVISPETFQNFNRYIQQELSVETENQDGFVISEQSEAQFRQRNSGQSLRQLQKIFLMFIMDCVNQAVEKERFPINSFRNQKHSSAASEKQTINLISLPTNNMVNFSPLFKSISLIQSLQNHYRASDSRNQFNRGNQLSEERLQWVHQQKEDLMDQVICNILKTLLQNWGKCLCGLIIEADEQDQLGITEKQLELKNKERLELFLERFLHQYEKEIQQEVKEHELCTKLLLGDRVLQDLVSQFAIQQTNINLKGS